MTRFSRRTLLAGAAAVPIIGAASVQAQTNSPITPLEPSVTPTDSGTVTSSARYFGDTGHNLKA
ncbi:MAG TPA: hypothetical protein VFI12_05850, partial [Thermomicrobiales bacterium]|nr:hypothetical protein [Thermomicrobiales bacterium]